MTQQLSISELLRRACIFAERDQEALIDAYKHMSDDPICLQSIEFVRQLKEYRLHRWGKSVLEVALEDAEPIPFEEVFRLTELREKEKNNECNSRRDC